jgi:hypothetical protein
MGIARGKLLPVVGAVTAAATTVAGFTPMVVASAQPAAPASDGFDAAAEPAADGVYESCSAYFGFGKDEGASDLVEFQVGVDGTGPGPAPTVENGGVEVVLVIENDEADVLVCVPEAVTPEQWAGEYGDGLFLNLPPYPGPGHYIYPSVGLGLEIEGFGLVTDVGFVVTGIADGYTLTSPEGIEPLAAVFSNPFLDLDSGNLDPVVLGIIDDEAGPDAVAAYVTAIEGCILEVPVEPTQSAELTAAAEALLDFIGVEEEFGDVDCSDAAGLYFISSLLVDVYGTTVNSESIVLGVVTTPTTAAPPAPTTTAPAAQPTVVTPRFTG